MKTYIGTKTIKAIPMDRLAYNVYRGWTLPLDENGEDEGFLVEYVDGGKSNHPAHEGYISWSPKDVFEKAYKIADTPKDRVVVELKELTEKLENLTNFMYSENFTKLDFQQCELLAAQSSAMATYATILRIRLKSM